jgi:hypothetical protein
MRTDESRLTWALILSVLLHGLLVTLLPLARQARLAIPQPPRMIDVALAALPKLSSSRAQRPSQAAPAPGEAVPAPPAIPIPKQQIVSPPDQGEEKAPPNTRFLSDRNNTVKEEMLHRGEPVGGSPEAKAQAQAQKAESKVERQEAARKSAPERAPAGAQVASLPKLDQLLPPVGDMIREGAVRPDADTSDAAGSAGSEHQRTSERTDLLRRGDPARNGGFRGGSMDFLPTVREGDITLLNTKAEQFAPFVRRVAARIFEHLQISLRQAARGAAGSGREFAEVEAVMSKTGKLVGARVIQRQGNTGLSADRRLLSTAEPDVFFDSNPPPGAEASDGNIHFILLVDLAVRAAPGERRGSGVEYSGVAGVGLN